MAKSWKPKNQNEHEIGYGKPPAQSRFQKGESGNPSGRPKGTVNIATVLLKTLREKVIINENGRPIRVTKLEASMKQLVNKAAAGDLRALAPLVAMTRSAEQTATAENTPNEVLDEVDHKVMLNILRRYEKSIQSGDDHEPNLS